MRIEKSLTPDGFREYVDSIQSCGYHPLPDMTPEVLAGVTDVLACHIEVADTWEDTTSRVVVRLADGRVGVFSEWSDSSGHG